MAVIITDMQMPVQCCQCVFHFRIDNQSTGCLRKPTEEPVEDGDERPKYCPLKEVNRRGAEMKKRVTVVLEVESDDEINMDDEFIKHDLEQEISCTSNYYEVISIETEVIE